MKKYLIYFMLSAYLLSFPEVRQMMKFPILVEHYLSHAEKDSEISVLKFLKIHYWNPTVKDADYKDDMDLPFKSADHSFAHFTLTILPNKFEIQFGTELVILEINQNFSYQEPLTSSTDSSVFRPPILG